MENSEHHRVKLQMKEWSRTARTFVQAGLGALCLVAAAQAQNMPQRFEAFPVGKRFTGKPAPVLLASREARRFRTAISERASDPPNFAGHYLVVDIGCGAACVQFFIVDLMTGKVFTPPFYLVWGLMDDQQGLISQYQPQYRVNSALLVAFGSRQNKGNGMYFYKWHNNRFTLVHTALKKD
jgi:hypothetical protein